MNQGHLSPAATAFVGTVVLVWLSAFGYLLLIAAVARLRRRPPAGTASASRVAIVVPTLNEEDTISAKLDDLKLTDYCTSRLSLLIVDGDSHDRTREIAERKLTAGFPFPASFITVRGCPGKLRQFRNALELTSDEIVVCTDADSRLEPGCVRTLVEALQRDSTTAVVGATVRPRTTLLEERIHWWFLNTLWRLEGDAFGAAMFSGVCFAVRRQVVLAALERARPGMTDDVFISDAVSASGAAVRLCRNAIASETRVPTTLRELLAFRRSRGKNYFGSLRGIGHHLTGPAGWRLARALRLWHFTATPGLCGALAVVGTLLPLAGQWMWPLLGAVALVAPPLIAVNLSRTLRLAEPSWLRRTVGLLRLAALTWFALVTLSRRPTQMAPSEET